MAALEFVLSALGAVSIAVGLAFMAGGVLGVLRFPDFYTRLHAARAADLVGALFIIAGLALASGDGGVALRLSLLGALLVALAPTTAHLAANAAHAAGLAPLAGRYVAPRPGARGGGA